MKSLHLNMKLLVSLFLLQVAIFTCFAQRDSISTKKMGLEVGVQYAYRQRNAHNQKAAWSLELRLSRGKWLLGSQVGTEKWFAEHFTPTKTGKMDFFAGKHFTLFRSNWRLAVNYGFRFYVNNQVRDNIYLANRFPSSNAAQNFVISYATDEFVNGLPTHYSGDFYGSGKEGYFNVLKMPFAHFFRLELDYQWKGIYIRAAYTPYWVHMRVKNAAKETIQYNLNKYFYDVGFTLSYRFQQKK